MVILGDGLLVGEAHVPGKVDPGVLADLGDECVDQRPPLRFGVDGGEMRLRQHRPHQTGGLAGIGQVVDDQDAFAVIGRERGAHFLQHLMSPCVA